MQNGTTCVTYSRPFDTGELQHVGIPTTVDELVASICVHYIDIEFDTLNTSVLFV